MSSILKSIVVVSILYFLSKDYLFKDSSPRSLTMKRMDTIQQRIVKFGELRHRVPASLSELPRRSGEDNDITDAWKRPMDYQPHINEKGGYMLTSLGADKRPGGSGDDQDIIGLYYLTEE